MMQNEMEEKDWRGILEQAKHKTELDWPEEENMDEDPAFQELWKEIGGNKIPEKKQINVNIPQQQTQKNTQKQEAMLA